MYYRNVNRIHQVYLLGPNNNLMLEGHSSIERNRLWHEIIVPKLTDNSIFIFRITFQNMRNGFLRYMQQFNQAFLLNGTSKSQISRFVFSDPSLLKRYIGKDYVFYFSQPNTLQSVQRNLPSIFDFSVEHMLQKIRSKSKYGPSPPSASPKCPRSQYRTN